jgi:hypothetical protein
MRLFGTLLPVAFLLSGLAAQPGREAAAPSASVPPDPGWPRQYTDGTAKMIVYQPQIDRWDDYKKLVARFAIALTPTKGSQSVYGALLLQADTVVDRDTRTVAMTNLAVTDVRFAAAKNDAEAKSWVELAEKLVPKKPVNVALDRVLAYLDAPRTDSPQAAVSLDPPPILVSTQPAVLVMIDGQPLFMDVENTGLRKAINTNWDLFLDKESGRYYLRNDKVWLSAKTLDDAWSPTTKLPSDFRKLPATDQYKEIAEAAKAPQSSAVVPLVLIAYKPSELVLLNGQAQFKPIPGTNLMWVVNTECDLFFDQSTRSFYLLTSGRWFRTANLSSSKWEAATASLPEDFKKIPADHPRANVLASVPGTRQADEAVLEASIPQTATISRTSAKADVQYIGEPQFEPIAGTNVSYAKNTPNDVLKVGDQYYLCLQGVWFRGATPNGPWSLADQIPKEIYSIPPSSPKYNTTFVNVYESTPETVTYGYSSGYTGVCVAFGVAMWGTGYYYPPYYGMGMYPIYWPPPYYTYGIGAWYNPATGAYARGSAVYGPYGGYGRAAAYNPSTGAYAWGRAAWGPYGAAAQGGFYNPSTGGWGGSYRATNGSQSWGTSVVGKGDQWARTASYSDSRGTVAAAKGSGGGKAIAASGSNGNQGFMARSGSGDFYAGHDGNVYKRDQSGQWYKNSGSGSWNPVDRPSGGQANAASRDQARDSFSAKAGGERPSFENRSGGSAGQSVQEMNREAGARDRGSWNADRANSMRESRESGGGGGWASRGGGGFGGRGGFRRR